MSDTRRDLPLAVFTCLAIAGAGCIAWPAIADLAFGVPSRTLVLVGTGLLAAGVAASLLHLGKPLRAPLAARGVGRSRVSNEVALALAALILGAAVFVSAPDAPAADWIRGGAAVSALALLVSIGRVYRIRGQFAWTRVAAWTPLSAGLLVGSLAALALVDEANSTVAEEALLYAAAVLCTIFDLVLNLARWRWPLGWPAPETVEPRVAALTTWLFWRILLFDLLPLSLLVVERPVLAVIASAAGLVVDRVGFYATAVSHTTEVEIQRVEQRLDEAR